MRSKSIIKASWVCLIVLLFLVAAVKLEAQSLDPATPAPVRSNNLLGHIPARDLGDSRLTDHYYAFTGTPGDLIITVQSRNLNGDLDVFTAGSLRPLMKLTMYPESTAPVTKGIYLRKREDLILRIEGRSPNDDEGTYQLFFGGSFEPIIGAPDLAENETPSAEPSTNTNRKTKRVSSVGARLPEPEPAVTEVASAPSPTPEATPAATPTEAVATTPEKIEPKPRSTPTRVPTRSRRPAGRTSTTTVPAKSPKTETTAGEDATKNEKDTPALEVAKPKTTARNSTRRATGTAAPKSKPETVSEPVPEPESGPRLIIETNDGTLINRSMSSVRRVTVENGQVVVIGKDGKIDRIQLANVVRMSIAQ